MADNEGNDTQRAGAHYSDMESGYPGHVTHVVNERALVRRIDLRLIPILLLIYVTSFLDRVNILEAVRMDLASDLGVTKELGATKEQRDMVWIIFFLPYVVPSNILLKKLGPNIWLSLCIVVFGVAILSQGFVTNYRGILATRFILGQAEAGIFPGFFYLFRSWYKKEEWQNRFTLFPFSLMIAGAFGGLLASAIAKMDGVGGKESWRWILILEGLGTIVVGGMAYFLVTDSPEKARWLTEEERDFVKQRTGNSLSH